MIIKVCGLRRSDNIRAVEQLGVDFIGMIFYPGSPRYVSMVSSGTGHLPDYAEKALQSEQMGQDTSSRQLRRAARVGVFVDEMAQQIVSHVVGYGLDYVQLHGNESVELIDNLRLTLDPDIRPGIGFIKAIPVACEADLQKCCEYEGHVDYFLFDTKCPCHGGSGDKFDWTVLSAYHGRTPFLLGGGIGPEDAEHICSFRHGRFAGIDLNSCFESEPAMKDIRKLEQFITKIRSHEQD